MYHNVCALWLRRAITISTTHDHDNDFSFNFNCNCNCSIAICGTPDPRPETLEPGTWNLEPGLVSGPRQMAVLNERGQFLMQFMQIRFN